MRVVEIGALAQILEPPVHPWDELDRAPYYLWFLSRSYAQQIAGSSSGPYLLERREDCYLLNNGFRSPRSLQPGRTQDLTITQI